MKQEDIYGDYSAFYDIYIGNWLDDLPFYLQYARDVRTPILEIGAGTGRLTIPFARNGNGVVAVDVSSSMLDILRRRIRTETPDLQEKIKIVESDASTLTLGERFDLTIVPYFTFNYFLTRDMQQRVLGTLSKHLLPDSKLLVDVFIPHGLIAKCPTHPVQEVNAVDPQTGNRIRGWITYSIEKTHQIEQRNHLFEVSRSDGTVVRSEFSTRRKYSFLSELQETFSSAGFSIDHEYGGFNQEKATETSERLVFVLKPTNAS